VSCPISAVRSFDGDFSRSLEEAQRRKHDYVAEQVGIGTGWRPLGCGCGRLLAYTRARGGTGVGVTLSSAQLGACRQHGLEVYLEDAREIGRARFGAFDAVASLGAFEHFCSPGDYRAERQKEIYRDVFARVSSLLSPGGRFYLQTMVCGHNVIPASRIAPEALRAVPPRDSEEWYLALLGRQFPGSWLPFGQEQVIRCAEPHFRLVSSVSGRLDYIETINRWNARIRAPSFRKTLLKVELLPRWLTSIDFRLAFTSGVSANQVCFERELLDHYRLVFEWWENERAFVERVLGSASCRRFPPLGRTLLSAAGRLSGADYVVWTRVSRAADSRSRRANFWTLPVEVFGSGPNSIASGHL
jgi:cyclopropane-fatty-acyl-phospholipid synthase